MSDHEPAADPAAPHELGADAAIDAATPAATPPSHALLNYTAQRVGLFIVAGGILYATGMRGFPLLLLALVISGIVSFFLLNRQRDKASGAVYKGVSKVTTKLEQRRADEDAAADRLRLEEQAARERATDRGDSGDTAN